ncbi:phage holin [Rouxiella badensis]
MDNITKTCIGLQCGAGILNQLTPDQWTALGVIGTLCFSGATFIASVAFKIWDRKHNFIRREEED